MTEDIENQIVSSDEENRSENINVNDSRNSNFQIYRERWLILSAIFAISFVNGIQKSFLSIVYVFIENLGVDYDAFRHLNQIPVFISLFLVVPLSRSLQNYGLRKMAHLYCLIIIIAHCIKAACCLDDDTIIMVPKEHRYMLFAFGEVLTGLAIAMSVTFPAKATYDWFPIEETTRALIIGHTGFSLAAGLSNFVVPHIVQNLTQLSRMSILLVGSAVAVSVIVIFSVRKSRPPTPPSRRAIMSASNNVVLRDGLIVMLSNPYFIFLIIEFSLNVSLLSSIQIVLEEILKMNDYTNKFCGLIQSQVFILGIILSIVSAAWVDKSADYTTVCRLSSLLFAGGFATFCISLNFPDIRAVLLVVNTISTLGSSLLVPSIFQVIFRSASGILPEATVSAITILATQSITSFLIYIEGPLKNAAPKSTNNKYCVLLGTFAAIVLIANISFAIKFKEPDRTKLKQNLRNRAPELMDERAD